MRENIHLSDEQIIEIKNKLHFEKERIVEKFFKSGDNFSFQNTEMKDSVDEANENILLSYATRLNNRENIFLKKIGKSLGKLSDGSYGLCDECGVEIPFERLMARITSDMCIVCKEESEMNEQHNFFDRKSKSLGRGIESSVG